jgi:hypothetical protein
MYIAQGQHSIVIKVYDKNISTDLRFRDKPMPNRKVFILLDAVPLDGEEKMTGNNGEAEFGKGLDLICNVDCKTGEIYIQGGQIFIDGLKIYDGAILPEMHFYI